MTAPSSLLLPPHPLLHFSSSPQPLRPPASSTPSFCITHTLLNNEDEVNPAVTSASQTDFIFTDLLQLHHGPLGIPPTHKHFIEPSLQQRLDSTGVIERWTVKFRPSLKSDCLYFPPATRVANVTLQHRCVVLKQRRRSFCCGFSLTLDQFAKCRWRFWNSQVPIGPN